MTPIERTWAEVVAELAMQEKKLVPQFGRLKALMVELLGVIVQHIAEEQKRNG